MHPDGSNVVNLTNNPAGNDPDANWSPDGTQIVFERFASGSSSNIFKMNADGSGVTQLTAQPAGLNRNPVWSPDGTRIAFDSGRDTATGQPNNQEVYTMSPDASDVRRGTNSLGDGLRRQRQAQAQEGQPDGRQGTATVSKGCTDNRTVTIRTTKKTGKRKGRLKVAAAFGGNARLNSSKKSTTVRFF